MSFMFNLIVDIRLDPDRPLPVGACGATHRFSVMERSKALTIPEKVTEKRMGIANELTFKHVDISPNFIFREVTSIEDSESECRAVH